MESTVHITSSSCCTEMHRDAETQEPISVYITKSFFKLLHFIRPKFMTYFCAALL